MAVLEPPDGSLRVDALRPYGTREGDCWLAGDENPVQQKLNADGEGLKLVCEMMVRDGRLQECLYVTAEPELIKRAEAGTERYWAQKASEN